MDANVVNLAEKLGKFSEYWSPKVIAQLNDYHVKLVKVHGDFVWHSHADTDELFRRSMKEGMTTLKQDGLLKVFQGFTDVSEVRRVCIA